MIDFEDVIRRLAPNALRIQQMTFAAIDKATIAAVNDKSAPGRTQAVHAWLQKYRVVRAINKADRSAIASAIVEWADRQDISQQLTTVDAIARAHSELVSACKMSRGLTSLASKGLWLCYPKDVPIFDEFVQRALWVISKLETGMTTPSENEPKYAQFVHAWKALYDRYKGTIEAVDMGAYPYRVRLFDKILWLIGRDGYEIVFRE